MIEWFTLASMKPSDGDVCVVLFGNKAIIKALYFNKVGFTLDGSQENSLMNITHWAYPCFP